jgi:predicted transcriptional regulator
VTPDLTQISAGTIQAYRYAGGDPNNAMALWEYHNGHRRGLPKGNNQNFDVNCAERFLQITAILKIHGPQTALQISEHMQIDKSNVSNWLLRMHTDGVVNRKSKPRMGTGGYALLYSIKPTPRAARVAQATQHASTGQNMGVSYDAE